MNLRIATDIHLFGADPTYNIKKVDDLKNHLLLTCDFLIGDIVDFKNCKKDELEEAQKVYDFLKFHFGEKYLTGNHECQSDEDKGLSIEDNFLCHSDSFFNGHYESILSRKKEHGAGLFERQLKMIFSKARKFYDLHKLNEEVLLRFDNFAVSHDFKRIVCGHKHPQFIQTIKREWGEIVILPRGISEVEL